MDTSLTPRQTPAALAHDDHDDWMAWRASLSPVAADLNERLGTVAVRTVSPEGKRVTAPARDRMWLLRQVLAPETFTTTMAWLMNPRLKSDNTVRSYADDLRTVAVILGGLDIASATHDHATVAVAEMTRAGHTARTINRRMTALQSLYEFDAFRRGDREAGRLVTKYHRGAIDTSAANAAATQALTKTELTRLYGACRTAAELLAVYLTVSVAGRADELVSSDLAHIRETGDELGLVLSRKGGKVRTFTLDEDVMAVVELVHGDKTRGPLLVRADGEPMTKGALDALLQRLGREAGVWVCKRAYTRRRDAEGRMHSFDTCRQCRNVTPHVLRSTKLVQLHEAGWTLADIQAFADHNDPKTTSGYLQRWRDRQLRADGVKVSSRGMAKHIDRFRREA